MRLLYNAVLISRRTSPIGNSGLGSSLSDLHLPRSYLLQSNKLGGFVSQNVRLHASLHLNIYRRRYVIALPGSPQTFELREMVTEFLLRSCPVAQDSLQS